MVKLLLEENTDQQKLPSIIVKIIDLKLFLSLRTFLCLYQNRREKSITPENRRKKKQSLRSCVCDNMSVTCSYEAYIEAYIASVISFV